MKTLIAAALLASTAMAHAQTPASAHAQTVASAPAPSSPAKKELVAKALTLQQPIFESIAREVVMRPALQIGQAAGNAMQSVSPEKREALSKSIDADIRKYIDESFGLLRERAIKLAPSTVGPIIEEKMTEEELKQLVTWLDSSAAKKYQQIGGDLQQALGQKLVAEAGPLLTPKVQALEAKVRVSLGVPNPAAAGASAPAAKAIAPKKAASK